MLFRTVTLLAGLGLNSVWAQQPTFLEASGQVSLEAESGAILNRSQSWVGRSALGGFSGSGYLSAEPNNGVNMLRGFSTAAPEVRFNVRFNQTGTYYVWIRGLAPSSGDNSIHAGLDGAVTKAGSAISEFSIGNWSWSSDAEARTRRATLLVPSAGVHVVNLWMKEDGFQFDKVVLTTNPAFVPGGAGPVESSREQAVQPAVLSLSSSAMGFSGMANAGTAGSQNLGISFGGGTSAWTASKNAGWLSLSATAGSGNATIAVSASTAGLAAGSYSDTITVTAATAQGSPKMVGVTLNVAPNDPPPTLSLSTGAMSFSATAGAGNPGSQNLGVSFSSGSPNWTAAKTAAWLSLSQGGGAGNGNIAVSALTAGLAAGTYTDTITVTAPTAQGSPRTVGVTFIVSNVPSSLSLSTGSMSFSANAGAGNPGSQNLGVSFSSGSPNWTAAKTAAWLSLSQTAAAGNSTIVVSAITAGLAAGTYTDTITVTAPTAQGSPRTVGVTFIVANVPARTEFYVSPAGAAANDGSINQPWDIFTAMAHPRAVQPGATIWVRGGNYGGHNNILHVSLVGTAAAPIIVRAYPGERATINSATHVGCCDAAPDPARGSYVWMWGLEFTSPVELRDAKNAGIDVYGVGVRLINNVFHDTSQGIGFWKSALNGEVHGNLSYHNGYYGTINGSLRGHGHGIYSQNDTGLKKLTDNIIFNQFGWGLHLYGSSASEVKNYEIEGNIAFNNGWPSGNRNDNLILAGGNTGLSGITVRNNYFYMTPESLGGFHQIGWLFSGNNPDAIVTDNYFIGGRDALAAFGWKNLTMVRNRIVSLSNQVWLDTTINGTSGLTWGDNSYNGVTQFRYNGQTMDFTRWKSTTGLDASSSFSPDLPTGVWTFVRKNKCEAGRGHVAIYNWDSAASVSVDLSSILSPGMTYEIRDAQNFFGNPVVRSVYGGGSVSIPMTGLSLAAIHGDAVVTPTHTAPKFGAFVVLQPGTATRTCF